MRSKIYSVRPPAVSKDGLETLFRVEMKRDDMAAEGLKSGDAISVTSHTTGKGGVGIAYPSSETAKSQGNASFVKVHDRLRKLMGLDLTDKCSIEKYEAGQRRAKTVILSEEGVVKSDATAPQLDIVEWAEITLKQFQGVVPGAMFVMTPNRGLSSYRKRVFTVKDVESDDPVENDKLAVPLLFDYGYSKVIIDGSSTATEHEISKEPLSIVQPSFTGLPGLEEQLRQLSTCVARVNLQLEERFQMLAGCVPILISGSSGTGKTAILNQLATAGGWEKVTRVHLSSTTYVNKMAATIANAFTEAAAKQPSLVLVDDIDSLAGRQAESLALSTVLAEHIRTTRGTKVQVVAAVRRPIDVDQKLLPVFKERIELPTPMPATRKKMLEQFTQGLAEDTVLDYVAEKTHAFIAEDLDTLCHEAYKAAAERTQRGSDEQMNGAIEHSTAATHSELVSQPSSIIKEDFQVALRLVHPSLMHELYIEVPKVFWSDIAGSAHVKRKLWEAVELPLKHPNIVSRLNLQLNHGILLYGPPGCSKTMTAKALATESGLNFIAVKGPELVSKYVGESEYKIREIFRKARAASPSVIFFDEIDSIAPNREGGGGHEGLNTVATLLNEMDGVEDVARVLVLAATNRPDAIDPALLRPGRLGTSLYVGPPDYKAILDILTIHTSKMGGIEAHLDLPSVAQNMADNGCFSGADIGAVCDSAGMLCATEAVDGGQLTALALQQRHLEQALLNAEPSLNKTQLKYLSTWRVGKGGQLV